MKVLMTVGGIFVALFIYFCVIEPFINQNRYEGIVVKSYNRDGTTYSEMIYVLDKHTGNRKRDWEK